MEPCIDKRDLELHLLGLIRDLKKKRAIECHLEECGTCQNYAEALRTIYREADNLSDETVERLSKTLLEKYGKDTTGQVILLAPFTQASVKDAEYLLAADSNVSQRYVNIQSYANLEEDIVARILMDSKSNEIILYLLSDEEDRFRDCIVEVEGIAKKFVPDTEDRIHLPELSLEDFENKTLYLKSSLATFDLTPFSDLKERVMARGQFQVESGEYDRIQIEVEEEGGKKLYRIRIVKLKEVPNIREVDVVVSQKGDKVISSTAHQGVAVFDEIDLENVLKIKIF